MPFTRASSFVILVYYSSFYRNTLCFLRTIYPLIQRIVFGQYHISSFSVYEIAIVLQQVQCSDRHVDMFV